MRAAGRQGSSSEAEFGQQRTARRHAGQSVVVLDEWVHCLKAALAKCLLHGTREPMLLSPSCRISYTMACLCCCQALPPLTQVVELREHLTSAMEQPEPMQAAVVLRLGG